MRLRRIQMSLCLLTALPALAQLVVVPRAACLKAGGTLTFQVMLPGQPTPEVQWSLVHPGTGAIDGAGVYRAPDDHAEHLTVTVRAVSAQDPGVTGEAQCHVLPKIEKDDLWNIINRVLNGEEQSGADLTRSPVPFEPAEPRPPVGSTRWLGANGNLHSGALPHYRGEPGEEMPANMTVEDDPSPFSLIQVLGASLPHRGPLPPLVGHGLPVMLHWVPDPLAQSQQLRAGEPADWIRLDVTGASRVEFGPIWPLTSCFVNTLKSTPAGGWLTRDTAANLQVRGVMLLAGSPVAEPDLADGLREAARFREPLGVAILGDGTAVVSDAHSHALRQVHTLTAEGTQRGKVEGGWGHHLQAGAADGVPAVARFRNPTFLAPDPATGSAFLVADSGNHTLRWVTEDNVETLAGVAGTAGHQDGAWEQALFRNPQGVALDEGGCAYVADQGNHVIRVLSTDGQVRTLAGSPGVAGVQDDVGGAARFKDLKGLACIGSHLYVVDGHAVRRIAINDGEVRTVLGAVDTPGRGQHGQEDPARASGAPCLDDPYGIAALGDRLLITERGGNRIHVLTPDGEHWNLAGDRDHGRFREGLFRDGLDELLLGKAATLAAPRGLCPVPGGLDAVVATGTCLALLARVDDPTLQGFTATLAGPEGGAEVGRPCKVELTLAPVDNELIELEGLDLMPIAYTLTFLNANGTEAEKVKGRTPHGLKVVHQATFLAEGKGKVVFRGFTPQGLGLRAQELEVDVRRAEPQGGGAGQ